jgi:hypothetical protein
VLLRLLDAKEDNHREDGDDQEQNRDEGSVAHW